MSVTSVLWSYRKWMAAFLTFELAAYTAYYFYEVRKARKSVTNEVVIFHGSYLRCETCVNGGVIDCLLSKTRRLLQYLETCESSIYVCLYIFTHCDLAKLLVEKHKKGKIVCVIVDGERADFDDRMVSYVREHGIPVKTKKSKYIMHQKFIIVDKRIVLMGSYNWTSQGTTGNLENVIITSRKTIVEPYVQEFDRLWQEFTPLL